MATPQDQATACLSLSSMEASRTQPAMERGGASLPEQGTGFPTASGQEEDCKDPEVHGAETGSCARQESHEAMPITPLLDDTWKDDPAVLGWMVQPGEPLEEEGWHMEDPEQVLPQPVPYHELLWRDWEDLCDPDTPSDERFDFTVLSYNILSQDLVDQNRELYLHCAPAILCWEYRWRSILQELQHWEADVLCLQEVQEDHYRKEVQRSLSAMGYSCHYKRRTGRKTDGCCTCYKTQRFMLLCQSHVEFFRPGIDQLNRDNVGLVLLLQPLPTAGLPDGRSFPPLCVANTHLLYNPRRGDIKLAQLALFLAEVDKVARTPEGSHCPIILCGDLNATPDSPLYRLLRYGSLNCRDLPAWKVSGQEKYCSYPYPRILPSPLWPDFLGVTDHCRYSSLHVPKGSGHAAAERLSYTRQRLLQLRYCLAACQRPPNLALIKGVTDNEPEPPRESEPGLHVAPTEPPRDPVLHVDPTEPPRESEPGLHVAPTEPPCESDPGLHVDPVEPPRESGPVLHVAPTEPPHERDPVLHVASTDSPHESDSVLHVASRDPPRQRDRGLHMDPTDPPLLRSPLSLQHDLHLTSVYSHFLPAKRHAEVTTLPMGRGASVDYIFYSAEPLLEGSTSHGVRFYEDKQLKLMGRLSLLSEADLWAAQGLPNPFCSSDHLCLLASFSLDLSAP